MTDQRPKWRFAPRTRDGWIATTAFVLLFMVAMPPITHTVLNRVEPWIGGFPFFFAILFFVYCGLIAVLIWTYRRRV